MWIFSKAFCSSRSRSWSSGFTLIELLVVSSIVIIITIVILFRHERFNSATLLRSLAYSVALSVRQAQLYGTSVRETSAGGIFAPSYGTYFKSGDTTNYFLAADLNSNGTIAIDGSEDVSPSPYRIHGNYAIKDFCATQSNSARHCRSTGEINVLLVRFSRPNPDALFVTNVNPSPNTYTRSCIELESPGEDTRIVSITNTGQIHVGTSGTTCVTEL